MKISNGLWIGLSISIGVAIVIMFVAFVWMRLRIKNIKKQYAKEEAKFISSSSALTNRENHGELLWELKSSSTKPLEDVQLEFLLNTSIRNHYDTVNVIGSMSDYEIKSFEKIANSNEQKLKAKLVIIFPNDDLDYNFDKEYKSLSKGKMIAIVNANKRSKPIKRIMNYLKLINAKYEWNNIGQGIVLVVK